MPAAKGHTTVSADIPDELCAALEARAAREGRSRSKAIMTAIRFWLEYAEPQDQEPLPKIKKGAK